MNSIQLRPGDHQDLQQLLELEQQAFASDRISKRSWLSLLKSASAVVLIASFGSAVAGSAVVLLRKRSSVARLYSIAVKGGYRGMGVGRALAADSLRVAEQLGCKQIRLESRIDNLRAHELFRSLGFQSFGPPVDNYYADGKSAIRFRRSLPRCTAEAGHAVTGAHSSRRRMDQGDVPSTEAVSRRITPLD